MPARSVMSTAPATRSAWAPSCATRPAHRSALDHAQRLCGINPFCRVAAGLAPGALGAPTFYGHVFTPRHHVRWTASRASSDAPDARDDRVEAGAGPGQDVFRIYPCAATLRSTTASGASADGTRDGVDALTPVTFCGAGPSDARRVAALRDDDEATVFHGYTWRVALECARGHRSWLHLDGAEVRGEQASHRSPAVPAGLFESVSLDCPWWRMPRTLRRLARTT